MQFTISAPKGIYRDTLIGSDGRVQFDSGWTSNTIVLRCHILIASFMLNNSAASGVQYMAVGQGNQAWDNLAELPDTPDDANSLVNQFGGTIPMAQLAPTYLDENREPTTAETRTLQLTATLGENFPTPPEGRAAYPLREFGLFGSFDGQPYMINSIRHRVIHKDTASTLVRTIQLTF